MKLLQVCRMPNDPSSTNWVPQLEEKKWAPIRHNTVWKIYSMFFFFFWYYDSRCTINSYIKVIKYIRIHDADFQVEFLIKNCSFPLFLFLSYIFWWWRYYIMRKIWTSSFFFLFLVCFFYSSNNVTFHSKAEERDLNLFWISQ